MKITISHIKVMAAVYQLQPCTISAINVYLGRCDQNNRHVTYLLRAGFLTRYKWQPPIIIDELCGESMGDKILSRPYMYELNPSMEKAAKLFVEAFEAMRGYNPIKQ